jgi:hypothetical protein
MQFVENEVREVGAGVWIRVAIDNISWCDLGEERAAARLSSMRWKTRLRLTCA